MRKLFQHAKGTLVFWSGLTKQTKCFKMPEEISAAEEFSAGKADLYFSVCLLNEPPKTGRGTKNNVSVVPALWADIDVANDARKSDKRYIESKALALKRLREFPVPPTLIVDSGGGYHAYWVLKEPISVKEYGVAEAEYLVEYLQHALRQYLRADIDATHDLTRLLRPPGSLNLKYQKRVEIVDEGADYSLSDINDALEMFEPPKRQEEQEGGAELDFEVRSASEVDLPLAKYQALLTADPLIAKTIAHDRPDLQDQSLSGYDMALAVRAAKAGWSAQEICDLLVSHRYTHGKPPKARSYYELTLKAAFAAVAKAKSEGEAEQIALTELSRSDLLERLSEVLGVEITHIYRYPTYRTPQYWLEANGQRIALPGVQALIEQPQLRRIIAAATGKYIAPMSQKNWAKVAQALLDACENVDVGAEASCERVKVLLDDYLQAYPPTEDDWEIAASRNLPFVYKSTVCFSLRHFALHIWQTSGERIKQTELVADLRRLGYEPKVVSLRSGKVGATSRYVWSKTKLSEEEE